MDTVISRGSRSDVDLRARFTLQPDVLIELEEWDTGEGRKAVAIDLGSVTIFLLGHYASAVQQDAGIVTICDRLIDVLQEARSRALARATAQRAEVTAEPVAS